jgi:predicted ester cyclase
MILTAVFIFGRVTMTSEEKKLLVRRFYEEVVNTGNVDLIEGFIAPEYVEVSDGKRYLTGIEGAKEHILGVRQTYPDLNIEIERQISEGEWVATCIIVRGTHRGLWLGIKPTGKMVTYTGVNIDRVIGGRIVEHGGAANMLGPLLDIGAIKIVGPDEQGST